MLMWTSSDRECCPHCFKRVQIGKIQTEHSSKLWWLPREMPFSLLTSFTCYVIKRGGVVFQHDPLFVIQIIARYCKSCNQLLIAGHDNDTKYEPKERQMKRLSKLIGHFSISCPICGDNLEDGKIRVAKSSKIWWLPIGVSLPLFATTKQMVQRGAVVFDQGFGVIHLHARYCRSCHYIYVDGKENDAKYEME